MQSLILLGASVRAAAFSALRAGFAPSAIDLYADRDLAAVCPTVKIRQYPRHFLPLLAAGPQAPWIYTGGLENHPRLVDRLAAIRPLLGNRGQALRLARDPVRLGQAATAAGCRAPRIAPEVTDRPNNQEWLVKPRRSSGGAAIRFASPGDLLAPPRTSDLQEFIAGEAASAVFVAAGGAAALLGATRQLLGRDFGFVRPFLYVGSLGPLVLGEAELARLQLLGNVIAEWFGLLGLFNVDFVRRGDGLWPVEVNPRYSASIEVIERVTDVNSIGLHVAACNKGTLPSEPIAKSNRFAGKAIIYAPADGVVPAALEEIAGQWNQVSKPPGLADIPRRDETFRAGQPVVTVLADGKSLSEVEGELRRRVAAMQQLILSV